MKIYKNLLCLILALAMAFALLSGCSSKNEDPVAEDVAEETVNTENTGFFYSEGIDENGFFEGVRALDYVELFDYQAFPIPNDVHQVPDDVLQDDIDSILTYYTFTEEIMDQAVANGDTVNIDYVGSVDGVEFSGGSTMGAGTDVTIGVTSYIDDFLEQLIGHMPGETFDVEVTFPDVYQEESLQGKEAVFVTTINYIGKMKEPELTDDFVKTNFHEFFGWETVAEMKEEMSAELRQVAIEKYVNEYLANEVNVSSVPDKLMEYQKEAMLQYYKEGAESYDMELDEFLDMYLGVSGEDELIEVNGEAILKNSKYLLVVQAVAEDSGLLVNEDDLTEHFNDYSEYEEQYGLPYLKQVALYQKVVEYIIDNAVLE